MNQELPLTPAMTAYARSNCLRRDWAVQFVLFSLGLAAVFPTLFSIVFFTQHRFLMPATAALWAVFLVVFGGGTIYLVLHDASLVSRDLAGGVYTRWTGPFTTQVIYGRYGMNAVRVDVGGRRLQNTVAGPLYTVGSASGTVDYLPVSGTLLEVRDESGRLLWSRLTSS